MISNYPDLALLLQASVQYDRYGTIYKQVPKVFQSLTRNFKAFEKYSSWKKSPLSKTTRKSVGSQNRMEGWVYQQSLTHHLFELTHLYRDHFGRWGLDGETREVVDKFVGFRI